MNRASVTCGAILNMFTFIKLKPKKDRRKTTGQKLTEQMLVDYFFFLKISSRTEIQKDLWVPESSVEPKQNKQTKSINVYYSQLLNTKDVEKFLKTEREWNTYYIEKNKNKNSNNFLIRSWGPTETNGIFKVLKWQENTWWSRILCVACFIWLTLPEKMWGHVWKMMFKLKLQRRERAYQVDLRWKERGHSQQRKEL